MNVHLEMGAKQHRYHLGIYYADQLIKSEKIISLYIHQISKTVPVEHSKKGMINRLVVNRPPSERAARRFAFTTSLPVSSK